MKTIYLIGFMGSGKSTVGHHLAKQLNRPLIDLDNYIESEYQMTIPMIFEKYGEEKFRQYEMKAMETNFKNSIVATGGGVVEKENNIKIMKNGIIIHLKANFKEIKRRLKYDETRPLWISSEEENKELYNKRLKQYENISHIEIDTTNKPINKIANEIIAYL